jgi:Thioesterase superfamily
MGSVDQRRRAMGTEADRLTEVREGFARSKFHRTFLGAHLERVAPGRGRRVAPGRDPAPEPGRSPAWGPDPTLADTVTGLALRTTLDAGTTSLTSSLSATFLRPGHPGKVTAMGRVVKRGTRFGYAEADVEDGEGRLLARAAATFTIMPEPAA